MNLNSDFSPKKQFQENNEVVKELLTVTGSSNFHLALSAALSEYVYTRTPTADQLKAVKEFIGTLMYLPRAAQPPPAYPVRQLDHSVYDLTPKPKPTETTTSHVS